MERRLSAASMPTDLACMTWQAMFGSGARIGIAVRTTPRAHLQTPQDPRLVRVVCCAAATGTATPTAAVARGASAASRTSPTTLSGSVPSGLRNSLFSFCFSIFSGTSPRPSPRMNFPFYFPKPWRPPWFGGYEGCGLQGCFTHWLRNFLKSKNDSWTYSAAFAAEGRNRLYLFAVSNNRPRAVDF